jgi:hypothetical protein
MLKFLIKYLQKKSTSQWNYTYNEWSSWFHSRNARMVKCTQIDKHKTTHGHLNGCRKSLWHNPVSPHYKNLKK